MNFLAKQKKEKKTFFADLLPGNTFTTEYLTWDNRNWEGELFVKLAYREAADPQDDFNAVAVRTGTLVFIESDEEVTQVFGRFVEYQK